MKGTLHLIADDLDGPYADHGAWLTDTVRATDHEWTATGYMRAIGEAFRKQKDETEEAG